MFRPISPHRKSGIVAPALVMLSLLLVISGLFASTGAQDFSARPTPTPTSAAINDLAPNPTEAPDDEIDDLAPNPTEAPTEEIDDLAPNPTEVPTGEPIDDVAIPVTGTVRVIKKDCQQAPAEGLFLSDYLMLCPTAHDGVEFVVNDANSAQGGTTANGVVEWTGVDPGAFTITETIPAGYGDPIVFCGYSESPGGGVQHPALMDATGGIVEGTFPDTMFEFVCYWMNVKESGQGLTGADDLANPGGGGNSTLTVEKRACPFGMGPTFDSNELARLCTTQLDGVTITVTHGNGTSSKPTVDGEATWLGLPLGPITVDEVIPGGYGDPIAVCETTLFNADGSWALSTINVFSPASGGSFELDFSPPADLDLPDVLHAQSICLLYNRPLGPGGYTQPQETSNSLSVRKWICPGTTEAVENLAYLQGQCELSTFPVDVTLTNADGASTQATDPAWTTWEDVPLGEFTLQETVPDGYTEPIVFCNWTAFYNGAIYDAFPHHVPSTGGLIEREITIPNTTYHCDLFNITTLHTITIYTRDCPVGVVPTDSYWSGNDECSALDGVDVHLTTDSGTQAGVTSGPIAWMEWPYVNLGPSGTIQIGQDTPDGYGEPVVWCVSFPVVAGDAQDFLFFPVTAENGTVTVQPEQHVPYRFSCHFFNIPDGSDFGEPDNLTANQAGT